jgi:hypothetical protein
MGTRRVTVRVCDSCDRSRQVYPWRITGGGTSRTLDLCVECAAPLVRLLNTASGHDLYTPVSDETIAAARRRRQELEARGMV